MDTGDEWVIVNRRKGKPKHPEDAQPPQPPSKSTTSYLITNLSPECTAATMWRKCCHLGILKDAFIPKRRDRNGHIYGFVRFEAVKNHAAMIDKLLRVKFGETNHFVVQSRSAKPPKSTPHQLPFQSHVHNPPPYHRLPPRKPITMPRPIPHSHNHGNPYKAVTHTLSYRDAVHGSRHKPIPDYLEPMVIRIPSTPLLVPTTWKTSKLVGEVKDTQHLYNANLILSSEGNVKCDFHYVGGLKLLLKFDSSMEAKAFLESKKHIWSMIFKNLVIWEGQMLENERVAQLILRGIPFHLRCKDTFDSIGGMFGTLLESSNFDWSSFDITTGKCYILTKKVERIEGKVILKWSRHSYEVWVCESIDQWIPTICMPTLSSESDTSDNVSKLDSSDSMFKDLEDGEIGDLSDTLSGNDAATPASPATHGDSKTISGRSDVTPRPTVHFPPTFENLEQTPSMLSHSPKAATPFPTPLPLHLPLPPAPHVFYTHSPPRIFLSPLLLTHQNPMYLAQPISPPPLNHFGPLLSPTRILPRPTITKILFPPHTPSPLLPDVPPPLTF
ncbi:hypothetical protein SSX86_007523 [Deinandra increscens subsp. villosa]|uniref:RRM domain-containing protein n=1 Tax=Deinandra increscens subsp. villosa TaxID=3103831 RepID=A0AAP0H502_9ASTR